MLTRLTTLAHNVLVWARQWLMPQMPRTRALGFLRMVRDLWTLSGSVVGNGTGYMVQMVLNLVDPLARGWPRRYRNSSPQST